MRNPNRVTHALRSSRKCRVGTVLVTNNRLLILKQLRRPRTGSGTFFLGVRTRTRTPGPGSGPGPAQPCVLPTELCGKRTFYMERRSVSRKFFLHKHCFLASQIVAFVVNFILQKNALSNENSLLKIWLLTGLPPHMGTRKTKFFVPLEVSPFCSRTKVFLWKQRFSNKNMIREAPFENADSDSS